MPQIARIVGPAGTGKTTELLRLMDLVLQRDIHDPLLIGFVSLTRAARREASTRAADQFGAKSADLEKHGWYRTLHSVCYRCLRVGKELLTGTKDDCDWLQNALQERVDGTPARLDQDFSDPFGDDSTDAGKALVIWDVARNRLENYANTWHRVNDVDARTPDLSFCRSIVQRYEQAKRLDHRIDFCDMLSRFAGYYVTLDGAEKCEPDGEPPDLPVWCLDEQQDTGALLHAVCERLTAQPSVRYVYLAGDDAQCIYSWAGSDPHWFRHGWPVTKVRVLPKSYRCPKPIMDFGEALLRECNDAACYADRIVAGADHDGDVERKQLNALIDLVDPRESWLLLARTNFLASRLARMLDEAAIPWLPTRGNGSWNAPVRREAIDAMMNLAAGAPIDGREWRSILKFIPARLPDGALLKPGTKSRFEGMAPDEAQSQYPWVMPDDLGELGATQLLIDGARSGAWRSWIPDSERYTTAIALFGKEAVDKPHVRIGSIHSVKGSEADNVALLTTIPEIVFRAAQEPNNFDEEQRVCYVAVTRAKKRLVILNETKARFRKRLSVE